MMQHFLSSLRALISELSLLVIPLLTAALTVQWTSAALQRALTRSFGTTFFLLLTCPGVAIHELSHAVFCPLFGHRIKQLVLFQMPVDGPAGYVEHGYRSTNPWAQIGHFFISTGPLWIGTALLLGALTALTDGDWLLPVSLRENGAFTWSSVLQIPLQFAGRIPEVSPADWRLYVVLYLFIAIGSHITLSVADLKGAARGFAWITLFLVALYLLDPIWNNAVSNMMQRLVPWSFHGAFVLFLIAAMLSLPLLLISMFEWIITRRQRPHSTL